MLAHAAVLHAGTLIEQHRLGQAGARSRPFLTRNLASSSLVDATVPFTSCPVNMAQARPHSKPAALDRPYRSPPSNRRRTKKALVAPTKLSQGARRCRAKLLRYFPRGFHDPLYEDWERGYKWEAHRRWNATLDRETLRALLKTGKYSEVAARAVAIEARTNLLFSFEKMALRDAVRSRAGARAFAEGLFEFLHGSADMETRLAAGSMSSPICPASRLVSSTWPVVTVVGFIAQPQLHIFLKPTVTRKAAQRYGIPLPYRPRPSWETYARLLSLARTVQGDLIPSP